MHSGIDMTPRLVVIEPAERAGLVLPLSGPQLVIGHSGSADLVVDDPFVSGRHAMVTITEPGQVTIWDLNSTGGTFVNDERLTGPRVLEPGDQVRMADLVARFEPADSVPAAAATQELPAAAGAPAIPPPPGATSPPQPPDGLEPAPSVRDDVFEFTVTGIVACPELPGIGGLTVQLVDKNVGGDQALASTQTSDDGSYAFGPVTIGAAYLRAHHKTQPDLQVHVSAGGGPLASSAVAYRAPSSVTLDVLLPAGAPGLPSEYEILTANLAAAYPGSLGALQEGSGRQDITYLANKTGWDARAVALAALADQFSQLTARAPVAPADPGQTQAWPVPVVSLRPEFYYALFRAGLPASADALFRADPATVSAIWQQAARQGVIPRALAGQVPAAVAGFHALSAAHLLTAASPVGISTLEEMLRAALPEAAARETFAQLYTQHRGDWAGFWAALEQRAGTAATEKLRLTGQLYCLTVNNEPLVTALLAAESDPPLRSPADLAPRGYYEPARWAPLITAVPPSVPGADADEQESNYARLLAAQVRLSFPTATVAGQVRAGVIPVVGGAGTDDLVATFLTENQGTFEIGAEPVQAYLARAGLAGTPDAVVAQVSRLQRVYQLTPDDTSMAVLLRHNLDSAFAVTRYDAAGFTRAFQAKLGGAGTAAAVHARARRIFASTLSITTAYLTGRTSPTLGGQAPVLHGYPPLQSEPAYPVVAYPTLENLFGSLDYCDCQDCRSILSPAAYLVDLLHYLDQPAPAAGRANPQDVLLGRRPDLQYLPLTCANTNTALPYIDLVNETLEYFVGNGLSLDGYQGHDTGDAVTTAELLASPQYVDDAAYATLQDAFFPPPLPFSRPLALLRLHLATLGVALPDAMAALRANDQLVNSGSPASYGWSDILIEQLGISRDEYQLFTDPSLGLGDLWGIPAPASALAVLQAMSLQDFSRRLGLSYDDLSAIIETRFVNQNAALIPRLTRLNAPFSTLKTLHDTMGTTGSIVASFIQSLPAGLDAMDYGGIFPLDYAAVVAWVNNPQIYPRIMDIITISAPGGNAGDCSGADLQFRYSNPDNSANLLTADDFTRLIRFVRLWQKLAPLLGDPADAMSIQHTDDILTALYPAAPSTPEDGFATLLLRLGFCFRIMRQLSLAGSALDQLLACWAPIGTSGPGSLYQAMFLTPTLLQQDPGAQTATVGPVISQGDVLVTAINGKQVSSYTVQQSDTPGTVAEAIAAAINAATVADPDAGVAMNTRFYAVSAANVITIKAGFTLKCTVAGTGSAAPGETYTSAPSFPVSQVASIDGTPTTGDTMTTAVDGVPVVYTVQDGDTLVTIAAGIAAAINATTVQDPYSGLPLNGLVVAASDDNVITFIAANAGAPFTLACGLTSAQTAGYTAAPPAPAAQRATITGQPVAPGDTLVTTINQAPVTYVAGPGDAEISALAASIAAAVSTDVQVDSLTGLPVSSIVQATSAGSVITFTAVDPASQFTFVPQVTAGAETYTASGPFPETATATITGPVPAGSTLTTTINTVPLVRMAGPGDTAATLATDIAGDINAATTVDAATGLPVNSVVSATAAGPVITVTGQSITTPFTLAASLSPSEYSAGRDTPPFADDGYGNFLADGSQTLFAHQPTLCAACNLTSAEFALIVKALGFEPATGLTLPTVSAIFRLGWLAHALGLSVLEFLTLRQFTGLDPFTPLDPGATAPVEPAATRFIRLLTALSAAGLSTVQALYLMWNQDISGTSAPRLSDITGLASTLRADFAAVEAQFTVQDDPSGSIAQGLMTLVYGSTASDFFFGLLNNTFSTSVTCAGAPGPPALPTPALPQPVVDASEGQLSYSDLSKQLSYAGLLGSVPLSVLDAAITVATTDGTDNAAAGNSVTFTPVSMTNIYPGAALVIGSGPAKEQVIVKAATATGFTADTKQAHDGHAAPFPITSDPALPAALAALAAASQQAAAPFFATYPELQPLYAAYAASTDPVQARRTALLENFLPILKRKRKAEQALATVTAAAGSDPSYASALLQDPAVLQADADATAAAITDLTALETPGLAASFFLSNDPGSAPDQVLDAVPALSYAQTATIAGTLAPGDVLTTTINGAAIPYLVSAADTSLEQLAGNVAAAVNASATADPATSLPINQVVSATASGSVVTIAGLDPSGAHSYFTLAASTSAGALSYVAGTQLPSNPGGGLIAGTWSGYLTVPQDGFYDVAVAADPGAGITVLIGTETVTPVPGGGLWQNQSPISLVAGQLTPITLTATSLKTTLSVSWQSAGLGWQVIPGEYLYSQSLAGSLGDTYVRFLKAASLAAALSLTAPELVYLAASSAGGGWLNFLASTPDAATGATLCAALTDLLDFSRIKLALSPADERLLAVLQEPSAVLPNGQSGLLSLTGWSQDSVYALLTQFYGSPDLTGLGSVQDFSRLYDAYAVVRACGLAAATLISAITNAPTATTLTALQSALRSRYAEQDWLTVISPINDAARVQQRDALVAYILQQLGDGYAQSVITLTASASAGIGATTVSCARQDGTGLNGVSAGMLVQGAGIASGTTVTAVTQAAAGATGAITLSAGLLAGLPAGTALSAAPYTTTFESPDSLLEYFLADTQTQPPVQTSRIRLALSQVQLFIERAIRNLEPEVSPADIDVSRWEWMKRYRLWQANREVFLWPENWLYPELRDGQSPFFQQMMSSLLQGDITDDASASAYLDYLTSLEEVAKLEPCGLYYQPGSADANETAYVVARTAGAHRKYYFRQLQDGGWTPWAQVLIDCEDMPVTPVVWNSRLFLFWLKAVKQAHPTPAPITPTGGAGTALGSLTVGDLNTYVTTATGAAPAKSSVAQAVLCWTEYYNGKWQPTKTSDINAPTTIGLFDLTGPGSFEAVRNQVRIIPAPFTGSNPIIIDLDVQFSLPADALVLAITVADAPYNIVNSDGYASYGSGGFVLHNTHSLPVRFEDITVPATLSFTLPNGQVISIALTLGLPQILDIPATSRSFFPAPAVPYTGGFEMDAFYITLQNVPGSPALFTNDILNYSWLPRIVDPQPVLPNIWDAPFIYEDRRNLFYVTTTQSTGTVTDALGFGLLAATPVPLSAASRIPRLVLPRRLVTPTPAEVACIIATGGTEAVVQRFLSTAPGIKAALALPIAVSYQGQVLSPLGNPATGPASASIGQGE